MSLATAVKTIEEDAREGVQNAINWATEVVEKHLPAAVAELKRLQSSPVAQAIESALLTPAEEAWVSELIAKIPSLRSQPAASGEAPAETPADGEPQADQSAA